MNEEYHVYEYEGPVLEFDQCVTDHWEGETMAPNARKARSNLTYQYKKQTNRVPGTQIKLPGKIKMVN